jgi:hypothetical protein
MPALGVDLAHRRTVRQTIADFESCDIRGQSFLAGRFRQIGQRIDDGRQDGSRMAEPADIVEVQCMRERSIGHRGFGSIRRDAKTHHARLRVTADELQIVVHDSGQLSCCAGNSHPGTVENAPLRPSDCIGRYVLETKLHREISAG